MGDFVTPWLNLYPQFSWHQEAFICGTRKGIKALIEALNSALESESGTVEFGNYFAGDGEGYSIRVHVLPENEFRHLTPYYTDDSVRTPWGDGFWPGMLAVKPRGTTPVEGGGDG